MNNTPMINEIFYPIPLIDGGYVLVSQEDYASMSIMEWRSKNGYARQAAVQATILMHRVIMERVLGRPLLTEELVDHTDRNRGNNRRNNLRVATAAQNAQNGALQSNNTTGWIGVTRHPNGPYVSYITNKGKRLYLGRYEDPASGARVYDVAARDLHKEFASLNFPDEESLPEAIERYSSFSTYLGQRNSSSRYYGVSYKPRLNAKKPWVGRVAIAKKTNELGYFASEEEAARAVDKYVKDNRLRKPINFPEV